MAAEALHQLGFPSCPTCAPLPQKPAHAREAYVTIVKSASGRQVILVQARVAVGCLFVLAALCFAFAFAGPTCDAVQNQSPSLAIDVASPVEKQAAAMSLTKGDPAESITRSSTTEHLPKRRRPKPRRGGAKPNRSRAYTQAKSILTNLTHRHRVSHPASVTRAFHHAVHTARMKHQLATPAEDFAHKSMPAHATDLSKYIIQKSDRSALAEADPFCEQVNKARRPVLEALYMEWNGPGWLRSDGWMSNTSISSWYGVNVLDGCDLTLDLHANQLVGEIPPFLSQLTGLVALDLSDNVIFGEIPAALFTERLFILELVLLPFLAGTIPEIRDGAALNELYLAQADVSGTIPASFARLNFSILYLDQLPHLSGQVPAALFEGPLTKLHLSALPVFGEVPADLFQLPSLQEVAIQRTDLSGALPHSVSAPLTKLLLQDSLFTGVFPEALPLSLQDLNITSTFISGTITPALPMCTNLTSLALGGSPLSGTLPALSSLTRLYEFDLLYSQHISGTLPQELFRLPRLAVVSLFHNLAISGTIPPPPANLTTLIFFNLPLVSGTLPSMCTCVDRLMTIGISEGPIISGTLPSCLHKAHQLELMSFTFMQRLSGTLPLLQTQSRLKLMLANVPHFSGTVPASYTQLHFDDFGVTLMPKLSGTLPSPLTADNFELLFTDLLSGKIPTVVGAHKFVVHRASMLSGTLPPLLESLPTITVFDVQQLPLLSGTIPAEWQAATNAIEFGIGEMPLLSGTVHPSLANLTGLTTFALLELPKLSGTLPPLFFANMPQLVNIVIGNLYALSGQLPPSSFDSRNLEQVLVLTLPLVRGSLPAGLQDAPHLHNFAFTETELTGPVPPLTNLTELYAMSLVATRFTGELFLPVAPTLKQLEIVDSSIYLNNLHHLCNHTSLKGLTISHARVNGPFPDCDWPHLNSIMLRGNGITRIGLNLWKSAKLKSVDISQNHLQYDPTLCPSIVKHHVGRIDLSHNPMGALFHDMLRCYLSARTMALSIHHCGVHGVFDAVAGDLHKQVMDNGLGELAQIFAHIGGNEPLTLTSLDISHNLISGAITGATHAAADLYLRSIQSVFDYIPFLTSLYANSNPLQIISIPNPLQTLNISSVANVTNCGLSSVLGAPGLQELYCTNTPINETDLYTCPDSGFNNVSGLVVPSERETTDFAKQITCPVWRSQNLADLIVDSSFYGYHLCLCSNQHSFWTGEKCVPCPADKPVECNRSVNDPVHRVLPDYYPILPSNCRADLDRCLIRASYVECRQRNVCSVRRGRRRPVPAGTRVSPGDVGYECADGYNTSSLLCSKCMDGYFRQGYSCYECQVWYKWIVPVLLLAVLGALCVLVRYQYVHHSTSASVSIIIFFIQLVSLLGSSLGGASNTTLSQFLQELSWAQPWAVQCVWAYLAEHHLEVTLICPLVLPCAVAAILTPYALYRSRSLTPPLFVLFYVWELLYLPVTAAALVSLRCDHVSLSGGGAVSFLSRAPYRPCGDTLLTSLSIITFVYFSVGYPVLSSVFLSQRARVSRNLDFLVLPSYAWWWQAVCIRGRAFVLTVTHFTLPYGSPVIPLVAFIVIQANLYLQTHWKPFRTDIDNKLSTFTLLCLIVIYMASLLRFYGNKSRDSFLSYAQESVFILCLLISGTAVALKTLRVFHNTKFLGESRPGTLRERLLTQPDREQSESGVYLHTYEDEPTGVRLST